MGRVRGRWARGGEEGQGRVAAAARVGRGFGATGHDGGRDRSSRRGGDDGIERAIGWSVVVVGMGRVDRGSAPILGNGGSPRLQEGRVERADANRLIGLNPFVPQALKRESKATGWNRWLRPVSAHPCSSVSRALTPCNSNKWHCRRTRLSSPAGNQSSTS